MLTCKSLLSQQWGGSHIPTAVIITGPVSIRVGSGVERWVRCAWSNDALCQLVGGTKQNLEDQSLLLRLLSSSSNLQAAVLDQLEHLAGAAGQPVCPVPQVVGPLDSNSSASPGPLFLSVLPCFLTEANAKGQSSSKVHISKGGRLERIRLGWFSACLGVSSSTHPSGIRASGVSPAYDATPALLIQWHIGGPPLLPSSRSDSQPRLDSYAQPSQFNRYCSLQQHSSRGYHDPRCPYPSKLSDPSENGRVCAPTGDGPATDTITTTSDTCASPCHPPSSLNTPNFSSVVQVQSPASPYYRSLSRAAKQQLASQARALPNLRAVDAPPGPDADQRCAAGQRAGSSKRGALAEAAAYDGGKRSAAGGDVGGEVRHDSEEGCADIPRSLRAQRNSLVLAVVPLAVTIFSQPGGAVLHQNAASIEYYGERTAATAADDKGLKPISYYELLGSLASRGSTSLGARQRRRQPRARAGPAESPRHGWDPACRGGEGKEVRGASACDGADGEEAQEEDVLQQLFELDSGKLEQMLAMVLQSEGEIWQGIVRVPATLQASESDADSDDSSSDQDEGSYEDMCTYITRDENAPGKRHPGYRNDDDEEGADVPRMIQEAGSSSKRPPPQPQAPGSPHTPMTAEIAEAAGADDMNEQGLTGGLPAHYDHHLQGSMAEVTTGLKQRIHNDKHATSATVTPTADSAVTSGAGDASSSSTTAAAGVASTAPMTSAVTFSFQKSPFELTSTAQPIPVPSGSDSMYLPPQQVLTSVSAAPGGLGQLDQDRASPFTLRLSRLLVRKDSVTPAAAAAAPIISYRSSSCVIESMASPDKEKGGGPPHGLVTSNSLAARALRRTISRLQHQPSVDVPIDTVGSGEGFISGEGVTSGGGDRQRGLNTVGSSAGGRVESTELTNTGRISLSKFMVEWTRSLTTNTTAAGSPSPAPAITPLPLASFTGGSGTVSGLVSGDSALAGGDLTLLPLMIAATTGAGGGGMMNPASLSSNPSHGEMSHNGGGMCGNLGRASSAEPRLPSLPNAHSLPAMQRLPVSGGSAVQCPGNKVGNNAAASSAGLQMPRRLLSPTTTEDIDGMGPGTTASASSNAGSWNNGPGGGPWQRSSIGRVSPDGPPNSGTPASFCPAVPEESGSLSEVQLSRKPTMVSSNPPRGTAGGPSSAVVSKALLASMSAACKPLTQGLLGRFLSYASERRFLPHRNDSNSAERRHEGRSELQNAVMSAMAVSAPRSRRSLRSMFGVAPPAVAKVSSGDRTPSRQASEDVSAVAYGELHVQRSTQSCLVSSRVAMSHPPPFGDGSTGTPLQGPATSGLSNINAATQPWRASSARRAVPAVSGRPNFHVSSGTSLMQAMSPGPRRAISRRSSFSAARRYLHLSQGPLATSTWQVLMSAHNDNEATQAFPTAPFSPTSTSPGIISSHGGSIGTAHLAAAAHALTVPAPSVPSTAQCAATRAAIPVMPTTLDMFGSSDPAARGSAGGAAVNSLFSSMQGGYSSHVDIAASMPSMLLVTVMASNNLDHTQLDMHAQFRAGGGAGGDAGGTGIRVAPNVHQGHAGGGSTNAFNINPAAGAAAATAPSPLLAPTAPFKCPNAQTIINMPSAGRSSKQPPSIVASQAQPQQSLERLRQSMEQSRESMERPRKSTERSRKSIEKPRKSIEKRRKSIEKPRKSIEKPRKSMERPRRSLERPSLDHGYQVANVTVAPATAGGTLGIPGVESEGDLVLLKILASDEEAAVALAGVACGGGGGGTSGCTLPTTNPQSNPWSSVLSSFRFGGSGHTASILSPSPVSAALASSTLPTSTATGRSTATAATGFTAPGTRGGPSAVTTGATVTAAPTQQQQPPLSSASSRTRPPSRVLAFAARLRTAPQPLAVAPASANFLTSPSFSVTNSFTNGNIMNDGGSRGESCTGLEPASSRPRTHVGVQQRYGGGSPRTEIGRFGCRKSMSSAALGDMVRRAAAVAAAAAASSSTSAAFPARDEGMFSYSNMVAVAAPATITADSSISHDDSTRHQLQLSPVSNHDGGANQSDVATGNGGATTREYGDGTNMGNDGADDRDGRPRSSGNPKQQHQRRSRCRPRRSRPQHQQQSSPQLQQQQTEQSECWHEVCVTAIRDPGSGSMALVVVQQDVSDKVVAERHLQQVAEVEHRLLEQIFPRHVLQYITEESVVPSHSPTAANTQLPVGPDGATMSGPPSAGVAAGTPPLNNGSTSSLTAAPTAPYNILSWRPQIRDCNRLATWHPKVTVLFADIQGFTPMCKVLPARVVMAFLNDLFTRFDAMLDTYRVYKVETIGDCYMVAGGLIMEDEDGMAAVRGGGAVDPTQADDVFGFAQAMLRAASAVRMPTCGSPVSVRVGIHSGPVVSGVVGTRMPRFCLFGDTVNTASRMESTGIPGSIHVSQDTYDMLSGQPGWQPTGGIEVKGKGIMATYVWSPFNPTVPTPTPTAVSTSVVLASSSFANTPAASSPPPKTPPMPSPAPLLPSGLALRITASAPVSAPCNGLLGAGGGGGGGGGAGGGGDTESMNVGFRSGSLTTTFSSPAPGRNGGGGRQDGGKPGGVNRRPPVAMASAGTLLAQMEALARSITGNLEEGEEEDEVGDRDDR